MNNYKQLDVWKGSMELIAVVYQVTKGYPKEELFALTSQTKRAAVSIAANIAEGFGRQEKCIEIEILWQKTIQLLNGFINYYEKAELK